MTATTPTPPRKNQLRKIDLERMTKEQAKYRDQLTAILRRCNWNVTQAAKLCRMSRPSMYRRLHILSIKIDPKAIRLGKASSIFNHKIAGVI